MRTIVVMPGGFHPFHAGHAALYQSAVKAFNNADTYVAASNDTKTRPFPFAIKEKLAKLAGVADKHFIQVKSPFQPNEITSHYNPNEDVLIFVRSEKDKNESPKPGGTKKDGTPAYFQPWTGKDVQPFSKHAYIAYLPTVEFGPGITSATEIRNAWPKLDDRRKTAMVMSLYPVTQKNPKLAANVVKMLDMGMGEQESVAEGSEEGSYSDKFVQSQIDYYTKHGLSGTAADRERINGSLNYYQHIKNKRIKDGTWQEQGMAEGPEFDKWADERVASQLHKLKPATYLVSVMDPITGEHWRIEVKVTSPEMAKERAEAMGYKVLRVKEKEGVVEGSESEADIDKKIEFHKQGQAAAQYKGSMNKMHAAKIRDLEAKKAALKKQGVAEDEKLDEGPFVQRIVRPNNINIYIRHDSKKPALLVATDIPYTIYDKFILKAIQKYPQLKQTDFSFKPADKVIAEENDEVVDPELHKMLNYAKLHYPNSPNKQVAFMKFVQRALKHSEQADTSQDTKLGILDKEVDQLQRAVSNLSNVTESADYLEEK